MGSETITTPLLEEEDEIETMPLVDDNGDVPALNVEEVIMNFYFL